jgi:hypothetical protein
LWGVLSYKRGWRRVYRGEWAAERGFPSTDLKETVMTDDQCTKKVEDEDEGTKGPTTTIVEGGDEQKEPVDRVATRPES